MDRPSLRAYSGVSSEGLRLESGSASAPFKPVKAASCSAVRRTTQTGLPRHSTVFFSPGLMSARSISTAAPAALARSEGWKVLAKGTATAAAPTAPAQVDAMIQVRLLESTAWVSTWVALMGILSFRYVGWRGLYLRGWRSKSVPDTIPFARRTKPPASWPGRRGRFPQYQKPCHGPGWFAQRANPGCC